MILELVQEYLRRAQEGGTKMSPQLAEEFGEACKKALLKQFNEKPKDEFTLRGSNVGRPLCQLKMAAAGEKGEPYYGYNASFRNLLGDIIEAAGVAVMRAAGVNINDTQQAITLDIGGIKLSGTYDICIDGKIYDIKSASPYSFANTFGKNGGFNKIAEDDHFGYLAQGYVYSEGAKKPFGGWIVINTATGEWCVTEVPADDGKHREAALARVDKNIRAIVSKEPFKREYSDIEEFFYRKPTGNRVLNATCGFCAHRAKCWPEVQVLPQVLSKAKTPKMAYYTKYLEEKYGKAKHAEPGNETGTQEDQGKVSEE